MIVCFTRYHLLCLVFLSVSLAFADPAQCNSVHGSPGECDNTALLQGRMHIDYDATDGESSIPAVPVDNDYSEDDGEFEEVNLAEIPVRKAPLDASWSALQQQEPEVIHYPAAGIGTKEEVRVCFLLINTLRDPSERFGRGKKFRSTWEAAFPTPRELGDLYFTHNDSAAQFINAASYGKVSVSGSVVGWYNDTEQGDVTASHMFHHRDRYILQARKAVNFDAYDVIYLVGLTAKGQMQRGWDRSHSILDPACEGSALKCSIVKNMGIIFMINAGIYTKTRLEGNPYAYAGMLPSKAWAHELVHSLGSLGHDNALMCGDAPLGEKCQQVNYANQFSVMGKSNYAQHPSCQSMEQLGWLQGSEVQTVTLGDEARTFTLTPRSIPGNGLKCLKVMLPRPFGGISDYPKQFGVLWIDHRQASGFDTALGFLDKSIPLSWGGVQRWTGSEKAIRTDGALLTLAPAPQHDARRRTIKWAKSKFPWAKSELIDVHADTPYRDDLGRISACKGKFADAALLAGETLQCEQLGFEIEVLSVGSEGAVVKLHKNRHMKGCHSPKLPSLNSTQATKHDRVDDQPMMMNEDDATEMTEEEIKSIVDEPSASVSQCHIVSVEVVADKWVTEPSWTIEDPNGNTWLSGKGPESLSTQSECAEISGAYTFTITDAHGDGICCEHGSGRYEVKVGDTVVASGGKFGWSETKLFSLK